MKIIAFAASLALAALSSASTTAQQQPALDFSELSLPVDTQVNTLVDETVGADADEVGAEATVDLTARNSFTYPLVRQTMIMAVNSKRQEAGLKGLCLSYKLMNTAQLQANYLAKTNSLSVTGEGGTSPSDRGRAAGFNSTGLAELVGAGYTKPDDVIAAWFGAADSKAIILGNYTHIGPGYTVDAKQPYVYYWAADFSLAVGNEECSGLAA